MYWCMKFVYLSAGHSSSALTKAGRQLLERESRMKVIADGVNGLFRMRRDNLVVCALRIWEASERRARGLGEVSMDGWAGVGDWRAVWKRWTRVLRFEMVICSVTRASASLEGAIMDSDVGLLPGEVCDLGVTFRKWDRLIDED